MLEHIELHEHLIHARMEDMHKHSKSNTCKKASKYTG